MAMESVGTPSEVALDLVIGAKTILFFASMLPIVIGSKRVVIDCEKRLLEEKFVSMLWMRQFF